MEPSSRSGAGGGEAEVPDRPLFPEDEKRVKDETFVIGALEDGQSVITGGIQPLGHSRSNLPAPIDTE
ncbi:MAG: hypothetical protein OXI92_18730 [Acidobacteriota bacterium]|nr:hypothetical protein [Acidobacteriota bacterium]